jgi:hypothetical protein
MGMSTTGKVYGVGPSSFLYERKTERFRKDEANVDTCFTARVFVLVTTVLDEMLPSTTPISETHTALLTSVGDFSQSLLEQSTKLTKQTH